MNAQIDLIEGTTRDLSKSQYFTPPELAERVVAWAGAGRKLTHQHPRGYDYDPMRVLEPSAGNGALVRPLVAAGAWVTAWEIDERYTEELSACAPVTLFISDFLGQQTEEPEPFDLCVMNPPYENGLDVAFILHALKFAPRVVGIFRSALLHGAQRKRELWAQVRPTRIAFLSERPQFDESGGSARSDFIVCELWARSPLTAERAEADRFAKPTIEWW